MWYEPCEETYFHKYILAVIGPSTQLGELYSDYFNISYICFLFIREFKNNESRGVLYKGGSNTYIQWLYFLDYNIYPRKYAHFHISDLSQYNLMCGISTRSDYYNYFMLVFLLDFNNVEGGEQKWEENNEWNQKTPKDYIKES